MSTLLRPPAQRIVLIGAGAIGSHIAASLREGTQIVVIDPSRAVCAEFKDRGYEVHCPLDGDSTLVVSDPQLFRPDDVVVVATSASVAAAAVARVPESVPVICLANGLIPALAAARNGSLSYGVVEFAAHCTSPGRATRAHDGWLTLQRESLGNATASLAAALDPKCQRVRLASDIDSHRHGKLMLNSSLDPVAAIIGGTIGQVFGVPSAFRGFRVLLGESLRVARAAGWQLAAVQGMRPGMLAKIFDTPVIGSFAAGSAGRQAAQVKSTLAQQIARGDLGEAEFLSGAIIREGARVGVPTPGHERAMMLLRRIAAQPGGAGGGPELACELMQR